MPYTLADLSGGDRWTLGPKWPLSRTSPGQRADPRSRPGGRAGCLGGGLQHAGGSDHKHGDFGRAWGAGALTTRPCLLSSGRDQTFPQPSDDSGPCSPVCATRRGGGSGLRARRLAPTWAHTRRPGRASPVGRCQARS
jgi:hypothetical protein